MQLFFSSHNPGKITEVTALFNQTHINVITNTQCPEAAETATTFVGNAIIKAKQGAQFSNLPTLGEDSGLCVPLLGNLPGLKSKRYAGDNATNAENILKLTAALEEHGIQETPAFFTCIMTVLRQPQDPLPLIATGICHGLVRTYTTGTQGFGYDPIFYLPKYQCTMAELSLNEKNRISARAQAAQQVIALLKNK